MTGGRWLLSGLLGLCIAAPLAPADDGAGVTLTTRPAAGPQLPLDSLPPRARQQLSHVLERPSLTAASQSETFVSPPELYRWLLERPDVTAKLWGLLGAKVHEVKDTDGRFRWTDEHGSEVFWSIA